MSPEPARKPEAEQAEPQEYTIDDLAAVSRVPSRTIRYYQSKGALNPPTIRGRVAYYNNTHLERLKLIAQLQDRGLRIDAIRELLTRVDRGELDVGEWLGLEAQLKAPWAHDQPRTMSEREVLDLAERPRAGLLADLVRTRAVERHGEAYFVRSPALLAVGLKLESVGVDIETSSKAEEILRKHLGKAASELAEHFVKHSGQALLPSQGEQDLSRVVEQLRPMGMEAVRVVFGQEMERVLREWIESGRLAKLPVRKKAKATP
jgi:DNA-binding transcriptional MerR regulator